MESDAAAAAVAGRRQLATMTTTTTTSSSSSSSSSPPPKLDAQRLQPPRHDAPPQRHGSASSADSTEQRRIIIMKGKQRSSEYPLLDGGGGGGDRAKSHSVSSSNHTKRTATTMTANPWPENHSSQRPVRTLPPWIASYEEDDGDGPGPGASPIGSKATDKLLPPPSSPPRSHTAGHHTYHAPAASERRVSRDGFVDDYDDAEHGIFERAPERGLFGGQREPERGRKWDHARDGGPVIMRASVPTRTTTRTAGAGWGYGGGAGGGVSTWSTFMKASMYGPAPGEDAAVVSEGFLREQTPGYERPWRGDVVGGNAEKGAGFTNIKRTAKWYKRMQYTILMHPLIPLAFRLIVLATSVIALGISSSVFHLSDVNNYPENPSTTMAVIVDVVAIPYICYITWDEYTGKPLGLRSPKAKIRLVLLDLIFIIFESANLSLAFEALSDNDGSCTNFLNGRNSSVCGRLQTLCGILFIALCAWSLTFAVSIFRLVERVGGREEVD